MHPSPFNRTLNASPCMQHRCARGRARQEEQPGGVAPPGGVPVRSSFGVKGFGFAQKPSNPKLFALPCIQRRCARGRSHQEEQPEGVGPPEGFPVQSSFGVKGFGLRRILQTLNGTRRLASNAGVHVAELAKKSSPEAWDRQGLPCSIELWGSGFAQNPSNPKWYASPRMQRRCARGRAREEEQSGSVGPPGGFPVQPRDLRRGAAVFSEKRQLAKRAARAGRRAATARAPGEGEAQPPGGPCDVHSGRTKND